MPCLASAMAWRTRSSSPPSGKRCSVWPCFTIGDEIEIEAVADPVGGGMRERALRRARASPACRGRCPRHARCRGRWPAGSRMRLRSAGDGAGARARSWSSRRTVPLCGPPPARAAASATPGVPTSFATTSDGFLRRGARAFSSSAEKKRAGTSKWRRPHGSRPHPPSDRWRRIAASDAGERSFGHESALDQGDDVRRRGAAFAAEADDEGMRMVDEVASEPSLRARSPSA